MSEFEAVVDLLEARGHRMTASRIAVVAAAFAARGHFTAEDLVRQVRGVGRATVFRTLRLLLEEDVICRVLLEDNSLRYRVSRVGHHHHLVCTACGEVSDFTECADDLIRELARRSDYRIEGHWLEVYGLCPKCAGVRQPQLAGVG
jgi:Fur family ferric uptake transcriptional regulator